MFAELVKSGELVIDSVRGWCWPWGDAPNHVTCNTGSSP